MVVPREVVSPIPPLSGYKQSFGARQVILGRMEARWEKLLKRIKEDWSLNSSGDDWTCILLAPEEDLQPTRAPYSPQQP
jgi:hypothetical protein